MSPESDGGIDKLKVLSAITGPPPAPASPPSSSDNPPPSTARREITPPGRLSRWVQHRSEVSAIVAVFVGILWLSVGLAQGQWGPSVIGILFGIGALAIWSIEVWGAD